MKNLAIMVALLATSGGVLAQGDGKSVTNKEQQTKMQADNAATKNKPGAALLHQGHKGHRVHGKRMK